MDSSATDGVGKANFGKRRLALIACLACGALAVGWIGLNGRMDLSIGIEQTWAGPVRIGVNGAVGDDARSIERNTGAAGPMSGVPQAAGGQAMTAADLAAYTQAQAELASSLSDSFRATAAAIEAEPEAANVPDEGPQSRGDAPAAMRDVAVRLRSGQ